MPECNPNIDGLDALVRKLTSLGADPEAQADDGSKPADLLTRSCSLFAMPTTQHDECLALLDAAVSEKKKTAPQHDAAESSSPTGQDGPI